MEFEDILDRIKTDTPYLYYVYKDHEEIANYSDSFLRGKSRKEILVMTIGKAIEHGLDPEDGIEFARGSDLWSYLSESEKKEIERILLIHNKDNIDRIVRLRKAFAKYSEYFDRERTSSTADKLGAYLKFFALNAPNSKIDRLMFYSFDKFYRPDGDVKVASEMQRIRGLMVTKATQIHAKYDVQVQKLLELLKDHDEKKNNRRHANEPPLSALLQEFLEMSKNLEIKNSMIEEIANSLKARNIKNASEINQTPDDILLRMTLRDCTIEGSISDGRLVVKPVDFNPDHYLTYAVNVSLRNKNIVNEAKEFWDFSVERMGVSGAMRFYEAVGYLMITKYPQPTERNIFVLIGDPNSGKGTHLAAIQEILTIGDLTLFAKAGPHKLADPREHFSRQNLQGKLALIDGDLHHTTIHDFSAVNDLFGGEPIEEEKKFRDPIIDRPVFKAIWASAPPLFKIMKPGGAWRRIQIIPMNPPDHEPDNTIKPRMMRKLDGFFLNALIGLSYLAANGFKFTDEQDSDTVEELWNFHSDSVQVWAQNLIPEPDKIERKNEGGQSTLDINKGRTALVENVEKRMVIDDLYDQYEEWAKKRQIEPVKKQTFVAWLRKHDYPAGRVTLDDGPDKGKRKYVIYASWNIETKTDEYQDQSRAAGEMSWEAYFSNAPLTIDSLSDLIGQVTRMRDNENEKTSSHHVYRMPNQVGQEPVIYRKTNNTGSGETSPPCPTSNQDLEVHEPGSVENQVGSEEKPQPEPQKSGISEEPEQHFYRVLKEFFMNGLRYSPGYTFASTDYLEDKMKSGYLDLINKEDLEAETNSPIRRDPVPEAVNDRAIDEKPKEKLGDLNDEQRAVLHFVHEYQDRLPLHCIRPNDVSKALSFDYPDLLDLNRAHDILEDLYERRILKHYESGFSYREVHP